MKRQSFIQELLRFGCHLERHGKKHDIYINPENESYWLALCLENGLMGQNRTKESAIHKLMSLER